MATDGPLFSKIMVKVWEGPHCIGRSMVNSAAFSLFGQISRENGGYDANTRFKNAQSEL